MNISDEDVEDANRLAISGRHSAQPKFRHHKYEEEDNEKTSDEDEYFDDVEKERFNMVGARKSIDGDAPDKGKDNGGSARLPLKVPEATVMALSRIPKSSPNFEQNLDKMMLGLGKSDKRDSELLNPRNDSLKKLTLGIMPARNQTLKDLSITDITTNALSLNRVQSVQEIKMGELDAKNVQYGGKYQQFISEHIGDV